MTNNGNEYDDVAATGGDGGGRHPPMPNAALVPFYYDPRVPIVTSVSSAGWLKSTFAFLKVTHCFESRQVSDGL